jgi:Zn-dependent protease
MLISLVFTEPILFLILFSALVFSLSLHEFAHAYTAVLLGDLTPKASGRLTLNPLAHLDPIGTLLLLIAGFGWAKPVPINPYNMKDPKKGSAIVSIAGPGINFILAAISASLLSFLSIGGIFGSFLYFFALYNVGLGIFNMLPLSPLDGFKFVHGVLPENLAQQWRDLAPYGIFILLFLLMTDSLEKILLPLMQAFLNIFGL